MDDPPSASNISRIKSRIIQYTRLGFSRGLKTLIISITELKFLDPDIKTMVCAEDIKYFSDQENLVNFTIKQ